MSTEGQEDPDTTHSGRLMLRMPPTLHAELAEEAQREGVSLNSLITGILAGAIAWRAPEGSGPGRAVTTPRWARRALIANLVVVAIAGAIGVALLVVALVRGG
jgi:hypothetical protein